jgi:hypothetical protein
VLDSGIVQRANAVFAENIFYKLLWPLIDKMERPFVFGGAGR